MQNCHKIFLLAILKFRPIHPLSSQFISVTSQFPLFPQTTTFPHVLIALSHHFHFLFFPLTFLRILSIVVVSSYHLMTPMMMFMTMIFMMTIFMTMIFMMMMFMTLLGMILMTMTMEYSPLCRAPTGAGPGLPEYKRN